MPLKPPETFTVTFADLDCPEYWAKLRDPRDMAAGSSRQVTLAMQILARSYQRQEPLEPEDRWAFDAMHNMLRDLLVDWNLPKFNPTGEGPDEVVPVAAPIPLDPPKEPGKKASKDERDDYDAAKAAYERGVAAIKAAYDPLALIDQRLYAHLMTEVRQRLLAPKSAAE